MKCCISLKRFACLSLPLLLLSLSSAFASNLLITRHFSGSWDQPDQESQGIVLQIGEQDGDKKVGVAYWFTYGEDLQTTWYLAVGPVTGNTINMKLYTAFNVEFMADNVEGNANVVEVGTLDLVFRNCNQGQAFYDTPEDVIGSGEFRIKRLISIYHTRCSGGISDDTPANAQPLQLEVGLVSARDDISGHGKAKFWERADRSDFKVEIKGMPHGGGPYMLKVCTEVRGEIVTVNGEGEISFRSPESDSKPLLAFKPRDCRIEVLDGEGVALTSGDAVLAEKQAGKNDHKHGDDFIKIKTELDSTGVVENAEGEAEFEIHGEKREFEIEVENVEPGSYTVRVDNNPVGDLEVVEDDGKTKGKLKFTDPVKTDTLELKFDPRDKVIEVLQDGTVILDTLFPNE